MKKILFIITRLPFPATDGTRERILLMLKSASKKYLVDIFLITDELVKKKQIDELEKKISGNVYLVYTNKWLCRFKSVLSLLKKSPIQSSYFYSNRAHRELVKKIKDYDVLYFHTIRFSKYINKIIKDNKALINKIILDYNDAISLNYSIAKRMATGIWKIIYQIEESRVKKCELHLADKLKNFLIITKRDKEFIKNNWEKQNKNNFPEIQTLKYGVTLDNLYLHSPENKNIIVIGNMAYPPNKQGVQIFIKKIWPEIIKEEKNSSLIIAGKDSDKLTSIDNNIIGLGFVDDVKDLISKQAIFLNPVNFGAGISTKALLAMSIGIPVISTQMGMAGIEESEDGINFLLFDYTDIKKSSKKIIDAINEKIDVKKIGENGKKIIKENYSEENSDKNFINIIEKVLDNSSSD